MSDESIIGEDNIGLYEEWSRLEKELDDASPETIEQRRKALADFLRQHPELPAQRRR